MTSKYKLRTTAIFFLFCLFFGVITFNLYLIQIKNHDFYYQLATQQYNISITQKPPRAAIIDRYGKYLALNKERVSAFVLPKNIVSKETLYPFLGKHFPQALVRLEKNPDRQFMFIKRRLTNEELSIIKKTELMDIKLLAEPNRYYPVPEAAPLIGLTDIDNTGIIGLELMFNSELAGSPSTFSLKKDARSGYFYFEKETTIAGKEGKPLELTLDSDLQFLAHEELQKTLENYNAKEGNVIIMDPLTGDILAMTTIPHFDPNDTRKLDIALTKNKTITECYELGSVFKVFTALAALEEGVVTPDELIDCKNSKTAIVDGRRINTVTAHGIIPFTDVVALSNNIGIALVAKRLQEKLYEHYKRIGFGEKSNIGLPGEQSGFINPPSNWSKQSIISLSYGYEVSATLLQLAQAFSMIANDGYRVTPKIIKNNQRNKTTSEKMYSQKTIDTIKNILEQTTIRGTARRARIKGYRIMSKTGTANLLIDGKYNKQKNIYTTAGIVQKNDYQRIIVVFINQVDRKRVYAATIAVPLFERVAERMLIHDRII